jgi:hypothetical protein
MQAKSWLPRKNALKLVAMNAERAPAIDVWAGPTPNDIESQVSTDPSRILLRIGTAARVE